MKRNDDDLKIELSHAEATIINWLGSRMRGTSYAKTMATAAAATEQSITSICKPSDASNQISFGFDLFSVFLFPFCSLSLSLARRQLGQIDILCHMSEVSILIGGTINYDWRLDRCQ